MFVYFWRGRGGDTEAVRIREILYTQFHTHYAPAKLPQTDLGTMKSTAKIEAEFRHHRV